MMMQGAWAGEHISARPEVKWSIDLGAPVTHISVAAEGLYVVAGGVVYSVGLDGTQRWDSQLNATGTPLRTQDGICVPTQRGVVQVLDPDSGSILASYGGRHPIRSSILSLGDTLSWVNNEGAVVTPTTQSPARLTGPVAGAASNGDLIIAGNSKGEVAATSHGGITWSQYLPGPAVGHPIIDTRQVYFAFGAQDGEPGGVAAFSIESGDLIWVTHLRHQPKSIGALGQHLVVPAANAELIALDLQHGGVRWRAPSPAVFGTQPAVVLDSIYTADVEGRLQRVEMADGGTVWTIELGAPITSGPAVIGSALTAGTADGRLIMLEAP